MQRRQFMAAGIAAGVAAGASGKDNRNLPFPYDLNKPEDLLECQVKLRGSLDDRMSIWWIRARQFAVVDTVLVPLYDLLNASFQRFDRLPDGGFGITMLELAYFTDLETGEPLEQWRNPFTNSVGKVPPAMFGPNRVSLTVDGLQAPENFPFGELTFEGQLGPGYADAEDVWVREDTIVRMTSEDPAYGDYIYNELVRYQGRADDIADPDRPTTDATLTYSTTSNWRPWMQSGDTPGHVMADGFGKKVGSVEELPRDYLEIAREKHPDVINEPERFLNARPG